MISGRWGTALFVAAGMLLVGSQPSVRAQTDKAQDAEPKADPDLGSHIFNALASDGKLWLIGPSREEKRAHNSLISFSLTNGDRTRHFRDGVIAMTKVAGQLWILRQPRQFEDAYWLLEWKSGGFASVRSFEAERDDLPVTLTKIGNAPAVVSTHAIRVLGDAGWEKTVLHPSLGDALGFGVATAGGPSSGNAFYVGIDKGEWGGGMLRADRTTGTVDDIESNQRSEGGFGTVLDSGLDPVNAIIADPESPGCVIAAVGLVHMMSSGRVLRVCDDKVSVVFEHLHPEEVNGNKFNQSDAFFGLVPATDGYWAVSNDGVYRFRKSGEPEHFPCPAINPWHGLWVSRDLPGVIVLATDMNWSFSLSGYTPLIVALDDD